MKRLSRVILGLTFAALPLAAQEIHWGVQAGMSFPQGDGTRIGDNLKGFVDSKPGMSLGVSAPTDFGSGHMVRPRIDYSYYSASRDTIFGTFHNKFKALTVGADYLYFPSQTLKGFYATAGLGYQFSKLEQTSAYTPYNRSEGAFAWAAGAGWQFTGLLGAELRYTSSHPSFGGSTFKADALNLGVTFKF